jgi:hypothetical protein
MGNFIFLCWSAIVITPSQKQQKPHLAKLGGFAFAILRGDYQAKRKQGVDALLNCDA